MSISDIMSGKKFYSEYELNKMTTQQLALALYPYNYKVVIPNSSDAVWFDEISEWHWADMSKLITEEEDYERQNRQAGRSVPPDRYGIFSEEDHGRPPMEITSQILNIEDGNDIWYDVIITKYSKDSYQFDFRFSPRDYPVK